jgi:hypothetical protein
MTCLISPSWLLSSFTSVLRAVSWACTAINWSRLDLHAGPKQGVRHYQRANGRVCAYLSASSFFGLPRFLGGPFSPLAAVREVVNREWKQHQDVDRAGLWYAPSSSLTGGLIFGGRPRFLGSGGPAAAPAAAAAAAAALANAESTDLGLKGKGRKRRINKTK